MEVNEDILNKLKYIDNYQSKLSKRKNIFNEETKEINFSIIKGKEFKLLKQFNKKFLKEFSLNKNNFKNENEILNKVKFNQLQKKLNLIHAYINLVGLAIMLKYLDMIVLVKRGGNIFFKNYFSYIISNV